MKNPGERLRQLLNIDNPDNSIEYEERHFERRSSIERRVTGSSPRNKTPSGPLATSATKTSCCVETTNAAETDLPGTPTSTSTLQANGHRLPRPHVNLMKQLRKESTGFSARTENDFILSPRQLKNHRGTGRSYYQEGNPKNW